MANSDKNILITPNVGAATGTLPNIIFRGADNTPITMRVLDNGTLSFEGTAGQLFSVADGLSGSIFSINDISGMPSFEILSGGLVKLAEYNGQVTINSSAALAVGTGGATTAATGTGTVATLTTTSAHGLAVGDTITVAGVTPTGYNGTYAVTAVPSATQVSYANTTTAAQTVAGTISSAAQVSIRARSAGTVGAVTRAAASQIADIAQWQNSSGTSLASISSVGILTAPIKEKWNIVASAISGTINIDFTTAQNWYYTTSSTSGATTINFRASATATLSSLFPVGESITYVVAVTTGATTPGYFSSVQVDGTVTGVTTRWLGGVAPTTGDASTVNAYTFTIVKTAATPTYTIFASIVKY